ncbi:MAG: hypothetical protein WCR23_08080 [Planctomycetota bacterium]
MKKILSTDTKPSLPVGPLESPGGWHGGAKKRFVSERISHTHAAMVIIMAIQS